MPDEKKPGFWEQIKQDVADAESKKATKKTFFELQDDKLRNEVEAIHQNAVEVRHAGGKYLVVDLTVNVIGSSVNLQALMNDLYKDGWRVLTANGSETVVLGSPFTHWHVVFEDSKVKP
jgi:hypothetical protein